MKVSLLAATFAAAIVGIGSLVGSYTSPAIAQGGRATGHQIAVVDVSVIFKKHQRFLAMTEKFKRDVEAAEDRLKKEYESIKLMQEKLKTFNAGSPEYKGTEQQIARAVADWQLKGQTQKKELMEIEGRIYYSVYRELDDAVKRFAQEKGISLVLRYASDPIDNPIDRTEIVKGINKSVVYVDPRLDITELVLQDLNRSSPAVSGVNGNAGPVGVAPRPVTRQ